MTKKEAIKFWKFRYENSKDFSDPHWEAQERREHREYVEALRMAIEALQAETVPLSVADKIAEERERLQEKVAELQEKIADRPHGEWIETTSGTICSNCGKYPYDDGEYHVANWYSDFCPSCGADMRKEKK